MRLKRFCDKVNEAGARFMLSNSDCKAKDEEDAFFDVLYSEYSIERVWASRSINSNPSKRGKLTEIVVRNFQSIYKYAAEMKKQDEFDFSMIFCDSDE